MGVVTRWIDERIDLASLRETLLDRKMPAGLTWWHTLGSATLTVFLVQIATGIVLAMYYSPSPDHAYDSIRYIERSVISGATVRGIHHWGASAMVLLVVAHMVRVFTMGSYKYPREANWVLGVVLFGLVLGFGFTGYLLPWDQKAFWATQVGTNIAGTTPVVGDAMVRLLRGGAQLGAATLARFYALHVLVLPTLLGGVVALHLALVIRQGIAARPRVLEDGAPPRTSAPDYPAYYAGRSLESKASGVHFWPTVIAKDIVVATVVVTVLVVLGRFAGAGLEPPADPNDAAYTPRPEWYFLPFFQLLKLVPGSLETFVAVGMPTLLLLVLLLLPFFDRRSTRSFRHRPVAMMSLAGMTAAFAVLFGASARGAPSNAPEIGRPLSSVERAGRTLFEQQQCGSCHKVAGQKTELREDVPEDTPELTEVGLKHTAAWMHSFIEDPERFHQDSKMPAFGPPTLSHQEIEELSQYLASLRGPNGAARQPEYRDTFPEPVKSPEPDKSKEKT
jgi:ubiquinol-cytochrome c reductase cytochrome b subunit